MQYLERTITGVDGTAATLRGYVIDNSEEMTSSRRRPAVLIIPGGGYEMTSDREAEPIALAMLGFGFHAFVLRYSVAPSRYPVALLEAAEAMRTIRDHADAWHVDAQAVVAAGFSAGGHLAASLGTSGADDILEAHGYAPSDIRPDGLMLGYPVITSGEYAHRGSFAALLGDRRDDPAMLRRLSLEHQVSDATPPTFIWHTVPCICGPISLQFLFEFCGEGFSQKIIFLFFAIKYFSQFAHFFRKFPVFLIRQYSNSKTCIGIFILKVVHSLTSYSSVFFTLRLLHFFPKIGYILSASFFINATISSDKGSSILLFTFANESTPNQKIPIYSLNF